MIKGLLASVTSNFPRVHVNAFEHLALLRSRRFGLGLLEARQIWFYPLTVISLLIFFLSPLGFLISP